MAVQDAETRTGPRYGAAYDLPPAEGPPPEADRAGPSPAEGLLLRSALWFCRLRWVVAVILTLFGLLGWFPAVLARLGLRAHTIWPFVAAAVLALANLGFLAHARRLARSDADGGAKGNLGAQITLDLLVLTVVVHYMGSLETYVAFAYLFHIVLACIFFPRLWSFIVTALACVLYIVCFLLEEVDVIPPGGIYVDTTLRQHMDRVPGPAIVNVTWATVTWIVVWYLASHLSAMVRKRDRELAETNRRLVRAQEQRTQHMLQTTHELKAPFAAVDANLQLLLKGYCGPFTEEARQVLERAAARCRRLARQVHDVLQLANLQAAEDEALRWTPVDLPATLHWCMAHVQPVAAAQGVSVEADLRPAWTMGVADHLKMLFSNLLANAVLYSRRGGRVRVGCGPADGGNVAATVEDEGIGIPPVELPHVFEAYYRTEEALRHHAESTGLGLAIVKHVVETHRLGLRVESEPGVGTRFRVTFPAVPGPAPPVSRRGEDADGLPADR